MATKFSTRGERSGADVAATFSGIHRRTLLQGISMAAAGSSVSGLRTLFAQQTDELRRRGKSMILLWMPGGPSQFETWDPKPGTANGGPTGAIATSVPGISIADNFPQTAKQMEHIAVVRSMTNKEGSHPRATYQMHTGYLPAGSVKHPSFGSNITFQLASDSSELPSFVSVGPTQGAGFLGMKYEPFLVTRPGQLPDNVAPSVSPERFSRRQQLLAKLTDEFSGTGSAQLAASSRALTETASQLIQTPQISTFDISSEPTSLQREYGENNFGRGCLLARRLIEQGVTVVEVRSGNWDTHQDNFAGCARNAGEVDPATAALIRDLHDRGMLDDTLIVWAGEFGRTPRINPREGRDHYPRAFSMMMAGGGIQGGQVYGATSGDGTDISRDPVTVPDLMRTICACLGVNPDHENMSPQGRPLKVVDGGKVVSELMSRFPA